MKTKSRLIPKEKMWISLLLITAPVIVLILLRTFDLIDFKTYGKATLHIAGATMLIGMFLLFITKWTKDDGDEMYMQYRLLAVFSGVVMGTSMIFIASIIELVTLSKMLSFFYSGFFLMFTMLLNLLYTFGFQVYKVKKELKNNN